MTVHTPMPKVSKIEVIATGSRRRWTREEKLRIVTEKLQRSVTGIYDCAPLWPVGSQLFAWRRMARAGAIADIGAHVFSAERLHAGDTTVPVLARGKCRIGRLWTYVRDDRPFAGHAPPTAALLFIDKREPARGSGL